MASHLTLEYIVTQSSMVDSVFGNKPVSCHLDFQPYLTAFARKMESDLNFQRITFAVIKLKVCSPVRARLYDGRDCKSVLCALYNLS